MAATSNGIVQRVRQIGRNRLPAQRAFVGDEADARPVGKCRTKIGELVVLRRRPRSSGPIVNRPLVLVEHLRRPLRGRPQRQAVLGERRRRPQLPAGATAARLRLRSSSSAGQSAFAQNLSTRRTSPSRSARWTRSSTSRTHTIGHGYRRPDWSTGNTGFADDPLRRAPAAPRPRRRRAAWRSPAAPARRCGATASSNARVDRLAAELPDDRAQLEVGREAQPVVDAPDVVVGVDQARGRSCGRCCWRARSNSATARSVSCRSGRSSWIVK